MALLSGCKPDAPPAGPGVADVILPPVADNRLLRCEALVPSTVLERHLQGWTLQAGEGPLFEVPTAPRFCTLRRVEPSGHLTLAFDCHHRAAPEELEAAKERLSDEGAAELAGLGRAAMRLEREGVEQITAWDDDTPCSVLVSWLGEGQHEATELARSLLEALGPAALVSPPGGEQ